MKRKNDIIRLWGRAYESYTKAAKKNDVSTKTASRIYMVAYSNVLEMKYEDINKAYEKSKFKYINRK